MAGKLLVYNDLSSVKPSGSSADGHRLILQSPKLMFSHETFKHASQSIRYAAAAGLISDASHGVVRIALGQRERGREREGEERTVEASRSDRNRLHVARQFASAPAATPPSIAVALCCTVWTGNGIEKSRLKSSRIQNISSRLVAI